MPRARLPYGSRARALTSVLATADERTAEVLSGGPAGRQRRDRVLVAPEVVDHGDLGQAAGGAKISAVGHGAGEVHRAEVRQRQDPAEERAARRLRDDLGRGTRRVGHGHAPFVGATSSR